MTALGNGILQMYICFIFIISSHEVSLSLLVFRFKQMLITMSPSILMSLCGYFLKTEAQKTGILIHKVRNKSDGRIKNIVSNKDVVTFVKQLTFK